MKVIEIFESIDGEVNGFYQGRLTTFIRFAGCNMNCPYCDTKDSRDANNGIEMSRSEIIEKVFEYGNKNITITGGEPLLQKDFFLLLEAMTTFYISVETNGTIFPDFWMPYKNVRWVVDYKLFDIAGFKFNITKLKENDFLKFVICNRKDYEKARNFVFHNNPAIKFKIAFSPDLAQITAQELLSWIQQDNLYNVIVNIQLHKLLNLK